MIDHVVVVIPARDEEARIGRCLASVVRAARATPVPVDIVVVADSCQDRTASVARSFRGVRVVEVDLANVGASRRRGAAGHAASTTWIAGTDADSVVPRHWITTQIGLADRGWDVVLGTVRPDLSELSAEQADAWHRTHGEGRSLGNIHGANLGVRASAYAAVGGYRELPEHEDVDLAGRLDGYRTVATEAAAVTTSGRQVGRTPGGFARFLREDLLRVAAPEPV